MNESTKQALPLKPEQKFEALKMLHDNQAELLRFMTTLDFRIFGGYITLQLILGSWLAEHRPDTTASQAGVAIIDGALALIAAALIYNSYKRRAEVAATFKNINAALCFTEVGAYLPSEPLLSSTSKFRAWRWWYMFGIVVAYVGIVLLLFGGLSDSSASSKKQRSKLFHERSPQRLTRSLEAKLTMRFSSIINDSYNVGVADASALPAAVAQFG
ncbi:MAG: hypothetical protein HZA90_17720 [Verrucomicrobia bacterium]|nr:hypothetical protein [Verrucomicrobiota bacterium]